MFGRHVERVSFTLEDLDRELLARGVRIPDEKRFVFPDVEGTPQRDTAMRQVESLYDEVEGLPQSDVLKGLSDAELLQKIVALISDHSGPRGIWGSDERMDVWEIEEERVKAAIDCVVSIWTDNHVFAVDGDQFQLDVKNYGRAYNLNLNEPFRNQPVSKGRLCTGFLVAEDVVATAGHCVNRKNVSTLRIAFGFQMLSATEPVVRIPASDVYRCVEVLERVYQRNGKRSDWALVRLDRKVKGRLPARLAAGEVAPGQRIYVAGHPCGLPLKYAPGASVHQALGGYFVADLDVYSSNSGSPVFDQQTGEVVGLVARGDFRDFRWTGQGVLSVRYPNMSFFSEGAHCTKVSEFGSFVADLKRKALGNGPGC